MLRKLFIISLLFAMLPLSAARGQESVTYFGGRHIKDDFCGVHINFQYCKCAFHKEYCDAVGHDPESAYRYISKEYLAWYRTEVEQFARNCIAKDGIWNRPQQSCITCDPGYEKARGRCIEAGTGEQSVAELYGLGDPDVERPASRKIMGHLQDVDGEVFVYIATQQKWVGPVVSGHPLFNGDLVYTTGRGEGRAIFYNSKNVSTINIGTETRLELPDPTKPELTTWGSIKQGFIEIYEAFTKDDRNNSNTTFNVRTPTVTTGVRGTQYSVSYDPETTISTVHVIEGEVDAWLPDDDSTIVTLTANSSVTSENGSLATSTISQADWEQSLSDAGVTNPGREESPEILYDDTYQYIDSDSVFPSEAANDLVGDISDLDIPGPAGAGILKWALILVGLGILGFLYRKFKPKLKN